MGEQQSSVRVLFVSFLSPVYEVLANASKVPYLLQINQSVATVSEIISPALLPAYSGLCWACVHMKRPQMGSSFMKIIYLPAACFHYALLCVGFVVWWCGRGREEDTKDGKREEREGRSIIKRDMVRWRQIERSYWWAILFQNAGRVIGPLDLSLSHPPAGWAFKARVDVLRYRRSPTIVLAEMS